MIIFDGTVTVDGQRFLRFKNELGKSINILLNSQTTNFLLRSFDRLLPAASDTETVEYADPEEPDPERMEQIRPDRKKK